MSDNDTVEDFSELDLPPVIVTSYADFLNEFYIPMLTRAKSYKRGVGYFTSNWIKSAARGIAELGNNGGSAKWLASPQLTPDDWETFVRADQAKRDELLASVLETKVRDLESALSNDTKNAIAWMIYDGLLEVRFAIPTGSLSGDFHDKWGVFEDGLGNRVAFHGSKNDSERSFTNYESYDVFCDWIDEREEHRVDRHEERFMELWSNENPAVEVYSLPDAVSKQLVEFRDPERPYGRGGDGTRVGGSQVSLWDFQEEAVNRWFGNDGRGIFKMATGTGKTYTGIGAVERLSEEVNGPLAVVVAVPFTHLANQWVENFADWGITDVEYVFGTYNPDWQDTLTDEVNDLNIAINDFAVLVTTHRTAAHEFFREQIERLDCETLLIGDEVHGMGSTHQRKALVDDYKYRLGLSATPERFYDELGTQRLMDYFGDIVFEFGLADAIPEYLSEYNYHPRLVELTDEELDEYRQYSVALAAEMSKDVPDDDRIDQLLNQRAIVVKSAENKYAELQQILETLDGIDHLLVYTNHEQIDVVQEILNEQGIIQHRFTFEEDEDERETLLKGFDEGRYDALVAMRCLDEGVDVPSTKQAILMSNSRNPKQFIQRRGRVLRKAESKDFAEIYDTIVVPSLNPSQEVLESERAILEKELRRFEEFASTARNEIEARNTIQRLKRIYQI